MKRLTLPGFIAVCFIHMKLISYHITQLLLLTFLVTSFGLQSITRLIANYHWEYFLVFSFCILIYLSLELVVYHPTIPFLICVTTLSVLPWMLELLTEGVTWVFINPLINFTSSFWFMHGSADSIKDARCNEFEGWMSLRSSSTMSQVCASGKQQTWDIQVRLAGETLYQLLRDLSSWYRNLVQAQVALKSPSKQLLTFSQGVGYTCPGNADLQAKKEPSFSCRKSQTSGLPHHGSLHSVLVQV